MTREEAIKIIDCHDIGFYDLSGVKIPADKLAEAFDMAIEALKDRPQGEWVNNRSGWKCSECGIRVAIFGKGNYCLNCGADMRGDAE